MANRKATLVLLCKTPQGWRRYPAGTAKNGRVKPGAALVGGKEQVFTAFRYQLRVYEGARMVYRDAGDNAAEAQNARERQMRLMAAKEAASAAGVKIEETTGRKNLQRELIRFVAAARDRGSESAAGVYQQVGEEFLCACGKTFADEVSIDDVLQYQSALRKNKASQRTIHNKHAAVKAFLRYCGVDVKAVAPGRPKFEKTLPEIYTPAELKALFASVKDDRLNLIFDLLLKTGLREQEGMYLCWPDLDLSAGMLRVRSKSEFGFKVKDCEERDIVIPASLLQRLKAYRAKHPKERLVTGTATGKPNTKLLRTLKRLAKSAGLNCGHCASCAARGECERWFLHKFRATYITTLLRGGMDLRTVMTQSGHSDLDSVMRYLRPAEGAAVKAKVNSIRWR